MVDDAAQEILEQAGDGGHDLRERVPVSSSPNEQYTPTEVREWAAAWLAGGLMLVLFVAVALTFALAFQKTSNAATDVAQVIIPPITTLLAAVLAYYYAVRIAR